MSGDTPDWPLMRRERVVRLTPSALAPSVRDRPQAIEPDSKAGIRRVLYMHWRFLFKLVVVDQFDSVGVTICKAENDSPVSSRRH